MKKIACVMICVCLALVLSACSEKITPTESAGSEEMSAAETTLSEKSTTTELTDSNTVDEKYVPKFMDIESGKSAVQSLTFGSDGWSLRCKSPYLFAAYGQYVLRYTITNNKIDKIVNLGEPYNGLPDYASYSSDGSNCIVYSCNPIDGKDSYNYFLINFDTASVNFISATHNNMKVDKFPDDVKNEIEDKGMHFSFKAAEAYPGCGLEPMKYEAGIAVKYDFHDKNGNTKEITSLKNLGIGQYVIVDESKIGAIMPCDRANEYNLGYYKFVIIDINKDKVIQECIINKK